MTQTLETEPAEQASRDRSRTSHLVGACTLSSRVLGFVRETLMASLIGVNAVGGALTLAFRIPNLFRRLFGEGAFTAVFLPMYTKTLDREGPGAARNLLASVSGALLGLLALLSALVVAACFLLPREWIVPAGEAAAQWNLTLDYLAVLFPYLVLVIAYALAMAVLNAHGSFLVSAAAPALQNVVAIVGLLVAYWMEAPLPVMGLVVAWFFLMSGLVQCGVQIPALARHGVLVAPRLDAKHPAVRSIAREMAPLVLGLGLPQLNLLADQLIAFVFLGEGANQYLSLAERLLQFPLGVIGIGTATVSFPLFARLFAAGNLQTLRFELDRGMREILALALPAAAGLFALAEPMTRALFEHGAFTAVDSARTAPVIAMYALGVPALCVTPLVIRVFYAAGNTRTPVKVSAAFVALNLTLSLALVKPFGAAGIAMAFSVTAFVNLFVLLRLARKLQLPKSQGSFAGLALMTLAAAICGAGAWGAQRMLAQDLGSPAILALAVAIGTGIGAYLLLGRLMYLPEVKSITSIFLRFFPERKK